MYEEYDEIIITKPSIKIHFDCPLCSAKYPTSDTKLLHTCHKCRKEVKISGDSYSIDAINKYLGIIHGKFTDKSKYGLRLKAVESYTVLMDSLVSRLVNLGIRVVKDHIITDINKKSGKDMTIREVIIEKIGALR